MIIKGFTCVIKHNSLQQRNPLWYRRARFPFSFATLFTLPLRAFIQPCQPSFLQQADTTKVDVLLRSVHDIVF